MSELKVAGFDVNEGLSRIGGDESFYLQLLNQFVEENKHLVTKIQQQIDSNDLKMARNTVHTFKGGCTILAAKQLQQYAFDLQVAIQEQQTELYEPLLASLDKDLNLSINAIVTLN